MGSPGQGGKKFLRDWQELQVNYECTAHNISSQLAGIVVYFPRVQAGGEYLFIYSFYLVFFFFIPGTQIPVLEDLMAPEFFLFLLFPFPFLFLPHSNSLSTGSHLEKQRAEDN